ncbi:MAG: Hsp70 family protein [Rickettsiales bacterium]|nr:Hsp70 family protein [Rickettsiales bacterium]
MALLQITEPGASQEAEHSQEVVVGIDLGTTNSLIAIVENEKVKFFADDNGNEIHPSIVNYDSAGNVSNAVNTLSISSIKRLMGKSFADVKNEKFDFEIDQNSDQKEVLRIVVGSRKIRPAEVSSEILKHLKNLAEKNLKTEIKKAVITVPAYFDEAAKNATKLAANLAGLDVLRLVNEPTAAALAYGLDNAVEGTYCVYDLGGGTFDVSILKMQKGVFKVLGVAGDNALGGDDFDNLVAKKFGVSRTEARKIKEEFSKKDAAARQDFENLIAPKIEKTFTLTKNLLEDLDLESSDIKGVILVGGSTRIPLVTTKLAEIFGAQKILNKLDPDRIVAQGAAWQAYNLSGKSQNLLLDVIPLSLGIEMMGGIVDKVIHRNTAIPTALAKEFTTYADNQTGMKLHIVQGERELAADCRSLAEFEIKNIPAMAAGLARVLVTFKVDADGLLTVSAEEKITHAKQEITVKPSFGLDENEVKQMLLDSLKNSQTDIANRLLIEAVTASLKDITIVKQDLEKFADSLAANEKKLIAENLKILENLIEQKASRDAILEAQTQLGKAAENLVLTKVNTILNKKIAGKKVDQI